MSTYYVGPFGRMLPAADAPSAERTPDHPANLPVTGSHQYQLPPPRASGALQFGTDPFLHHRNQGVKSELGGGPSIRSQSPGLQYASNEQLPSVSQLLTPTIQSPRSLSPYNPQCFGIYMPNGGTPRPRSPSDSGLVGSGSQDGFRGSSAALDAVPPPHTGNLPPLAHITTQNSRRESQGHPMDFRESPTQQMQPGPFSSPFTYSARYHGRELSGELTGSAVPESESTPAGRPRATKVRPHVVDEKFIDGAGLCYIYADGTHCPKNVDGEPVNANWGITKAGKPRKRLAQACLTCREKKIKCQPNLPKCDQCQKSGRECRFESAPRGHRSAFRSSQTNRPDTRDSMLYSDHLNFGSSNSMYSLVRASDSSISLTGSSSQSPTSDASMLTPSAGDSTHDGAPDLEFRHGFRALGTRGVSSGAEDLPRRLTGTIAPSLSPDYTEILAELKHLDPQNPQVSAWSMDPYEADPEATLHYVECYFTYINDRLCYLFPRRRFILWLRSCQTKSLSDNMLLFAIMALGSVFSDRSDRLAAMKRYSRTARYAVEHSRHSLSLQLAQSHIIMSLWYHAVGALVNSCDAVGSAVRTVCGLRYNVESGIIVDQSQPCEYGLHPQALMECRRRTFWATFLMDRFSCFYTASSTFLSSQTAYLRLPCREEVYEAQQYTTVPFFQNFLNQLPVSPEDELSGISTMALLIDIMSLWGDVSDYVVRLSLAQDDTYGRQFEGFHATVTRRSEGWLARLPDHLAFATVNMERNIRARKADAFMALHLLYNATLMKLNRHARYQYLRPGTTDGYVNTARQCAVKILHISQSMVRYGSEHETSQRTVEPNSPKGIILNPFLGYVILSAVDVLSAAGLIAEIPECISSIRGGLDAVRELSRFWDSSLPLATLIERRLDALEDCLRRPLELEGKMVFLVDGTSLDSQVHAGGTHQQDVGVEHDLLYGGLPRERLLSALGAADVLFSGAKILWIRERN